MSYTDEYYKARKKRENALSVQSNEGNNHNGLDSYSQEYYAALSKRPTGSFSDGDKFMSNFWNNRVNNSIATLNKYRDTINSGGYLSADDLTAYEKALSYYKLGSNKLRDIFKKNGYETGDDESWNTTMSGMDDSLRSLSDYFSQWKDEEEFNRDKSYRKTGKDFSELDEKDLTKRIAEYKEKATNAIDKDTEAKAQKELSILNAQLEFKQKVNEALKLLDDNQKEAYLYYLGKDLEDGTSYADEYIASVTRKDDSGMQFFQKGPFADGYQFGDVTKAIVGTFDDAFYTIGKGGFRFAEGVADWMGHGVANIADWLGNGTYADVLRESAAESYTDKFFAPVDAVTDKYSMLGKTSDAILEGVGQAGAMYAGGYVLGPAGLGLGPLGTTAATTGLSYLSGTGHGINEAYQAGATDAEAQIYGRISGFADAVSELLFGGLGKGANALGISKGLSSADDMLAKTVSKLFKGQLGKNLAEFGVKAGAEGLEEVIAGSMQALGKKMTYLSEEDIGDIFADENLLEQFIVGSITSGIMQAGDVKTSNKAGRDFITNLSRNEQLVVDTEFSNRLQEATKDGKKLTKKQQNKLYEDVISDMDKGLISTDTIESALGGETYKGYKSATEQENSLKKKQAALSKEIEALLDKPNPTIRDSERLAAARQELATVEKSLSGLDVVGARYALTQNIIGLTKNDSRLHESFNESARRGQDLQLDVEKFTGSARTTAENLLKGGLNNTYKSRTLADLLTRISADKNVVFNVSTAEKLAAAGLGVEGRTVNGVTTKDGIILNIESVKSLNSIVGHEITHTLEQAGHYDDLAKVMKEYAELKGDYQKKRSYLESVYAKTDANGNIIKDENGNTVWIRDDVNIDAEVTADLVGDYLFTDEDFIRNLSAKHQNLFQKVYAEIKYLLKSATAGSTEARKLEKVKKMFDKAYRESTEAQKNTTEDGGVRYSISNFSDQVDAVNSGTFDRSNNLFVAKTPDIYGNIGLNSDLPMLTTASHIRKAQMPKDASKHQHGLTEQQIKDLPQKLESPVIIMDSIDTARNSIVVVTDMLDPDGLPVIVSVKVDGKGQYNNVEIDSNFITSYYGRERFNNFMQANINANTLLYIDGKKATALATGPNTQWFGQLKNYSFDTIIRKTRANVNKNNKNTYSAAVATGDIATAKKFVDQAAEEAGYTVKAYHGTSNNFWTFEKGHKRTRGNLNLGDGFYFAADRSMAENYTNTGRVIDGYLKLENPYTIYGTRFYNDDLQKIAEQSGMEVTYENVSDVLQQMGYDGIIARNYDGNTNPVMQYVVFDPSQIKSADPVTYDNNGKVIPLSERFNSQKEDIRYSLSPANEDIAPVGNFNIHGWDIADFDAPIRDDINGVLIAETNDQKGTNSDATFNADAEPIREDISQETETAEETSSMEDVSEKIRIKIQNLQTELDNNQRLREESSADYEGEIARLQSEYEAKKNKTTRAANDLLRRIERLQRLKNNVDADYASRISDLKDRIERMSSPTYKMAAQRKAKQGQYTALVEELVGDTSTWVDKNLGLSYKVNTFRRNLHDIVRDANGNKDTARADAIYDELQGNYNRNEAELKRESRRIKSPFAEMRLNKEEDAYAHMLGELWYNPQTTLTEDVVKDFFNENQGNIDVDKVDDAIKEARKVFDDLIERVNKRLREQGMKEIPYRKGYFPHFTKPHQGFLAKLFNWKPVDNEIPTSIAGITESFNPERSWQSFNKERKTDVTDYSLLQGLDTYVHGALDWIYHIEDIQKRRALENYIRYIHSDEGIKERIKAIQENEEYDADEAQAQIDLVYAQARNPLNNFVTDLRAGTNTLAGKKSSADRAIEDQTNRKVYSVMTNLNNRISANMVVGSISSALTNFIPITQSWTEVSPLYSLRGMKDTIASTIRDDGIVNKSTFLTNRLMNEENLSQTNWDKVSDKATFLMEAIDSFTSQTVWRSKYLQNISEGMSEAEAIKNADQFAENVIAGRSRGNMPTIFDAKNPITKIFTAFQLEVANQYGYFFKDAPQDAKTRVRLVKGYATAFIGAYLYNALFSTLTGRTAAFDPARILEELFRDMGLFGDDDEEEPEDVILNLTENILQEVPFVGGLLGGGRIPLSSALPYSGEYGGFESFVKDVHEGNYKSLTKEMLKPLYYLAMPMGGGQLKKTIEGLWMFSEEHPISGSYTDKGNLRFPVEKTFGNVLQAGLFGQYANKNARDYFDNERSPLKEKQIQEFIDVDLPIADYWKYREGLAKQDTLEEKFDYIADLDLPVAKKNILINNIVDRKEPVDMTGYEDYSGLDEFDFAIKNPGKYAIAEAIGGYKSYTKYTDAISNIQADKDKNGKSISGSRKKKVTAYIESLPLDYGTKIILHKSEYPSDDTYNMDIVEYLDSRDDISYDEMVAILKELGFTVNGQRISWD